MGKPPPTYEEYVKARAIVRQYNGWKWRKLRAETMLTQAQLANAMERYARQVVAKGKPRDGIKRHRAVSMLSKTIK